MTAYDFIFSKKPAIWVSRHVAFWFVFTLHFSMAAILVPGVNEALTPQAWLESLINISYFLLVYTLLVLNVQLNINSTDNTFLAYLETDLQKQPIPIITEKISNIPAEAFLNPNINY